MTEWLTLTFKRAKKLLICLCKIYTSNGFIFGSHKLLCLPEIWEEIRILETFWVIQIIVNDRMKWLWLLKLQKMDSWLHIWQTQITHSFVLLFWKYEIGKLFWVIQMSFSFFFDWLLFQCKTRPCFDQGSIRTKYIYQLGRLERISYFKSYLVSMHKNEANSDFMQIT